MLRKIGAITLHTSSVRRLTRTAAILGAIALCLSTAATGRAATGGSRTAVGASRSPSGAVMKIRPTGCLDAFNNVRALSRADCLYHYKTSAGNLAIVSLRPGSLAIDTYNPTARRHVGTTRSISIAGWPDWGGFYAAPDGDFYVLVGRNNFRQKVNSTPIAVRRYNRNWTLLGTAYLKSGGDENSIEQPGGDPYGVYQPFVASAAHMVLVGNRLVVDMGRLIFSEWDPHGIHHQTSLTFEVNVDTMTAASFYQLHYQTDTVSHSFSQFVAMNGDDLVVVERGDGYPRAIQMGVMPGYPNPPRHAMPNPFATMYRYDLFDFNGPIGDNVTGTSTDGLLSGPSGIVVVGASIPQPNAPHGPFLWRRARANIYAIAANPSTGAHTFEWLTQVAGRDEVLEPRVVQIGVDRYAVLFSVCRDDHCNLQYRLIDSAGAVLARASVPGVMFPASSDPILIGRGVYWVGGRSAYESGPERLFALNVADPTRPALFMAKKQVKR